jgi:hypothetical protein
MNLTIQAEADCAFGAFAVHKDEILLDQQRDVVVVFWASCILQIQSYSRRIDAVYTSAADGGEGLRIKFRDCSLK